MEITQKTSRKRKQSPSSTTHFDNNPFHGVLTRQKSHKYFFSCNRSGKSRKCTSFQQLPTKNSAEIDANLIASGGDGNDGGDGDESNGSIKDLRARRVFSKPPKRDKLDQIDKSKFDSELINENPNFVALEKCDSSLLDVNHVVNSIVEELNRKNPNLLDDSESFDFGNPNLPVFKNSGNPNLPVLKKCDLGLSDANPNLLVLEKNGDSPVSLVAESLNDGDISPEKCMLEGGKGRKDEKFLDDMNPNMSNDVEICEVENEEAVQTTPPEAVFIIRKADEDNVFKSRSCVSRSVTKEISPSKNGCAHVNNFSDTRKEMTLNKCSRRKVFKVPNSFTYKRLLPYLMDMAKDEPCELSANLSVKNEMDVEEKPVVSLSEECAIDGPKLLKKLMTTMATCVSHEVSIDQKDAFSDDRTTISPSSQTDLACSESQIPDDPKQDVPQYEHISTDNLAVTLYTSKMSPEASKKDTSLEPPCHMSVGSEGECIADDIEFKTEESSISKSNSSNMLELVVSSGAPGTGPTKGILKRNPRGCRGICSCLYCTSFRLNAEKSFEFSRNQLLEADELAQDLMKEVSTLSRMLKESVAGATAVGGVSVNQVEEACSRSSNVEDMARSRLSQMHEDLFVHCRTKALHRPRVNFSGNVQENGAAGELTKRNDPLILH